MISTNKMGLQKKRGNNFEHFVLYPSATCERTANEQSKFLVEELGKKLRNKGFSHLFGAHLYHCLRQCGFSDHKPGVSSHCEEQSGEKHYGPCPVILPPKNPNATSTHIHILIFVTERLSLVNLQ